jgi:ribosomal protein L32
MEKYGVQTNEKLTKVASEAGQTLCPKCGESTLPNQKTPICPVHGTQPFEEQYESSLTTRSVRPA